MTRLLIPLLLIVATSPSIVAQETPNIRPDAVVAQLLPPSTVIYAEINDPRDLIATIFDHPLRAKIEALPQYAMAIQTPGYKQFQAGKEFVEAQLGMPWREALQSSTENGVYVGVDAATQGVALLMHGKDADSMKQIAEKFIQIAKMGEHPERFNQGEYRGVTAYELDKAKFAVVDDWWIVTNQQTLGKQVIDRMLDRDLTSLQENEKFRSAQQSRDQSSSLWAYVDIEAIRDAGAAKNLFAGRAENPVLELLVGGILSSLQHTPHVTANLSANTNSIALQLSMPHQHDWIPEQREYYFGSEGQGRGPAIPQSSATLFTLSTYRKVSEMWLRAGDLFDEKVNDGFAQADANLTTLFAGRDFGEDILGSLEPEIAFIATRQNFAGILPKPTIELPAFALSLRLKDPKSMTRELRRTFQSMIGFFNVLGAMQGNPQLEMDMEKLDDGGELITSAYVPEEDHRDSTDAPMLFNFSPTVGFSGERFVVASSETLARELTTAPVTEPKNIADNSQLALHADVLKQVLADNRGQLIAQNMLTEGNSREEAEAAIDLLLDVVGYFKDASLRLGTSRDKLDVQFQIRVKP